MGIDSEFILRVMSAHDIVDVVGRSYPLKPSAGVYEGNDGCPECEHPRALLLVRPELQTFKCFQCGRTGDVIEFVMWQQDCTFSEALSQLAAERGMKVSDE